MQRYDRLLQSIEYREIKTILRNGKTLKSNWIRMHERGTDTVCWCGKFH